jgi:carotenoid 1,2-hydratase
VIELGPATGDLPREIVDIPGGFSWWYADMVDEDGNGVVCIWSFGLPFLPGYVHADRMGCAPTARQRPSLTLSVYKNGKEDFYLFTELEPESCHWGTDSWQFGSSSAVLDRAGILTIKLDLPIPGARDRFLGKMTLTGNVRKGQLGGQRSTVHSWEPVLLGQIEAFFEAEMGDEAYSITGRGYHDRNAGTTGLHRLGIERWRWMRLSFPDRDIVVYLLDPVDGGAPKEMAFEVTPQGAIRALEIEAVEHQSFKISWAGPRWPRSSHVSLKGFAPIDIRHAYLVDTGPFYQRTLLTAEMDGVEAVGVGELVLPNCLDLNRHRWLVRMRVHNAVGRNSMWLPLFSGPSKGRWKRLLQYWGGVGR